MSKEPQQQQKKKKEKLSVFIINMLPNLTGARNLVNVTITYIDKKKAGDIDNVSDDDNNNNNNDDDEDTNNNDLLAEQRRRRRQQQQQQPEQCFSSTAVTGTINPSPSSDEKVVNRSVINSISSKMTIQQVNETLITRRPSTITIKPLVTEHLDADHTDGCFGTRDDDSMHDCGKGINVKFQDLIYRARRGFSWDRCKCQLI